MSNIPDDINEPGSPVISGDWKDDDPGYVEDLFQQHPQPPTAKEMPTEPERLPAFPRKKDNRLVCVSGGGNGPLPQAIMALPVDANRQSVIISSTVSLIIADGKALLPGPMQSAFPFESGYGMAFIVPANVPVTLPNYTGAIWFITAPNAPATPWTYSLLAVTE